ncbi:MAG: helix-turn-helix domain-containing protein [Acidimicrobiales bacterium]
MVIAGSEKTTRRRAVRRQRGPSGVGSQLRAERERQGLSLEVIQDRTGVRQFDIEALEAGDLSRFPDEKTVLIAVRRCAETLGLPANAMTQAVSEQWRSVMLNPPPAAAPSTAGPAPTRLLAATTSRPLSPDPLPTSAHPAVLAAHLSRYPGDSSHLLAFTQTAQVPRVGGGPAPAALPPGLRFDSTDSLPAVSWPGRTDGDGAPLALRVALWTVVCLLVISGAAVAVHHWKPAWLADLHLVSPASSPAHPPAAGASGHHTATGPGVTSTATGAATATASVRASAYQVAVTTTAPCWIRVTSPASFTPVFASTVPAGTTKIFSSTDGQLTVDLGASHATVTVQILGHTVSGWSLTPAVAPYTLTFHSVPG